MQKTKKTTCIYQELLHCTIGYNYNLSFEDQPPQLQPRSSCSNKMGSNIKESSSYSVFTKVA